MSAHRYWRCLIIRTDNSVSHVGASEVEFRTSQGGSDVTGSGTASASSVSGSDAASYAFDNNASTNWSSNGLVLGDEWLKYDFGSGNAYDIVEVAWTTRSADQDGPTDLFLQYSDDDSAWHTAIAFFTQPQFTSANQQHVFNSSSTGAVVADVFPPKMTAANTPSPYVISASSQFSGGYVPYQACDYNYGSEWFASTNTGWLKIDLGVSNAQTITSVGLKNEQAATRMPKDFTIQGSNNDSSWSTLKTVTGETSWGNNEVRKYTLTSPGSYRYYKIDTTLNNGDGLCGFDAFYLFAEPPPEITGTMAATESGSDTCLMTGCTIFATGTMAATESGSDTCSMTGLVGASIGTMAAVETGSDTCSMTGTVLVKGTLSATETGADTCAMTGKVVVTGTMAASEAGSDTCSMVGVVTPGVNISGTLPQLQGYGELGIEAFVSGKLPAMTGEGQLGFDTSGYLPALIGSAYVEEVQYVNVSGKLPAMTGSASLGFDCYGKLPTLQGSGALEMAEYMSASGFLPNLQGHAEVTWDNIVTVYGVLPQLTGGNILVVPMANTDIAVDSDEVIRFRRDYVAPDNGVAFGANYILDADTENILDADGEIIII